MTNMTLRTSSKLTRLLDQAAADAGSSRHAFILAALEDAVQRGEGDLDPDLCIGYIALVGGEIDSNEIDCPSCGQPLDGPHIPVLYGSSRPILLDPICSICVT